ncbi:hypothetical protein BDW02DRAFT_540254 [Decorospora gaudefroyi]|uniref:Uncharacterized protein n=1 Tax=Decorospora gaudefroyi TaxID=184978 RepID=A0A6A5KSY2_9PLEO|nr:hypothetical protein BDW02DRAFT_540254 [Decorospora gaudefroyi]
MGIPIGWNVKREEAKEKDVLRADVTGQRSPIRRRARPNRSPRPQTVYALDTDFTDFVRDSVGQHSERMSRPANTRSRLAPPPVPEVSRIEYRTSEPQRQPPTLQREETSLHRSHNRLDGLMGVYETPRADPSARRDAADAPEYDRESSDSNAVAFPPLRRMGRRTIADGPLPASSLRESWSPASTLLDGLGDRNRSATPLGDDPLEWDRFLDTIVEDTFTPTAGSSFASAAASASFTNSHPSSRAGSANSAASSQTHLTVPSRRPSPPQNEQFMRACDTSEDDTASDTEEEEVDVRGSIRRLNGREVYRNRIAPSDPIVPRRRIRPSYFSNEPPIRDTARYSPRVVDRALNAGIYLRRYYGSGAWRGTEEEEEVQRRPPISQFDGPTDEPPSASSEEGISALEEEIPPLVRADAGAQPLDQELRDARSLLERLSRREDISDDFWASVGLTRSFADPVERFQELERL